MVSCERVESFHSLCTKQWHESHAIKTNNQRHTFASHGRAFRKITRGGRTASACNFLKNLLNRHLSTKSHSFTCIKLAFPIRRGTVSSYQQPFFISFRRNVLTTQSPSHYIGFAALKNAKNTWKVVNEIISIKDKSEKRWSSLKTPNVRHVKNQRTQKLWNPYLQKLSHLLSLEEKMTLPPSLPKTEQNTKSLSP